MRCDGEWLEIPRYASDYSRANKSKYTQEYNEVLSKINQLQQTTDLRDLTRQWIR
ncbi:hypothetical protein JCM19232_3945 [Vibrio ishigakensis]|uniref:Uncharacterized protein n=1 Tax=Vibrio ishigakensis TaxID=1481914 RepID=A0A0B8PCW3_9VIBR|nr:hypothetical protein JCM19232_3945 [Vibrio ishigakensis]